MSSLFTQLEQERARQRATLETAAPPKKVAQKVTQKIEQKVAQRDEQKGEQVSKKVSKVPRSEAVEMLHFSLRKEQKVKLNTEVPLRWKKKLDDLAHQLGVGKYDLLMFIIAQFLGEAEESNNA